MKRWIVTSLLALPALALAHSPAAANWCMKGSHCYSWSFSLPRICFCFDTGKCPPLASHKITSCVPPAHCAPCGGGWQGAFPDQPHAGNGGYGGGVGYGGYSQAPVAGYGTAYPNGQTPPQPQVGGYYPAYGYANGGVPSYWYGR